MVWIYQYAPIHMNCMQCALFLLERATGESFHNPYLEDFSRQFTSPVARMTPTHLFLKEMRLYRFETSTYPSMTTFRSPIASRTE